MKKTMLMTLLSTSLAFTAVSVDAGHDKKGDRHCKKNMMKADVNGDGKVSFEEFKAARMARIEAKFKRKDINQDGFIDESDLKVLKEKRRVKKEARDQEDKTAQKEKYIEDKKRRKKHFYKY